MIKPRIITKGAFKLENIIITKNKTSNRKIDPKLERLCEYNWDEIVKNTIQRQLE